MQQQLQQFDESAFAPSFSCYSSSSSTTSAAISKVISEEQIPPFHEEFEVKDFEFSLSDEEVSIKEFHSQGWTVFPVFNRHLLVNNETKVSSDETDDSLAITGSLGKLFIGERDESSSCSYSSSEGDELESSRLGSYCMWRPKAGGGSTPHINKGKKSRSTGSRSSDRWIFRFLLRRSNSEGKEPMVVLTQKKVERLRLERDSGEGSKAQSPVHEQFYVQRRAENEAIKKKSYLPYKKDLVGLFANVKGKGKMLPF